MPQLSRLRPGSRIISHDFDMKGAVPVQIHKMTVEEGDEEPDEDYYEEYEPEQHTIYKWIVPWKKAPKDPS